MQKTEQSLKSGIQFQNDKSVARDFSSETEIIQREIILCQSETLPNPPPPLTPPPHLSLSALRSDTGQMFLSCDMVAEGTFLLHHQRQGLCHSSSESTCALFGLLTEHCGITKTNTRLA